MEWTIRHIDKINAIREAWGVSYGEAARMIAGDLVAFYTAHTFGKDAPDVVAVEYLGTGEPTIASITIEPYKEITPIECIKAL